MKNVTTKQSIASIFTRIWLLVLFVLNFTTFAGIFMITLFPDFSAFELNKSFQTFSMWSSINNITNWGIVILSLISFIVIANIVSIVLIKRASFKIGKKNKILKYFMPMTISIIVLMIISLINKFGFITFGGEQNISLLYKFGIFVDNYNPFNLNNGPFTIAWLIVFIIFILTAIGYVIDFIIFIFRVLFARTHSKVNIE